MANTKTKTKAKAEAQQNIAGEAPQGNLPALQQKMQSFMGEFRARQTAYEPLLPPHVSFEKFEASVRAAIVKNPEILAKCIPATIFRACAEAAELGLSLSPTLREADILIVYNKRMNGLEAQFRPRYMGLMKLARQSGEVTDIDAHEVYKWDEFDYEYGVNKWMKHKPAAKPIGYDKEQYWGVTHTYCVWEINGKRDFEVMELADVIRIMNRTTSKNRDTGEITGPWVTDFAEMARKTAVRRASKYMPLSSERLKAFATAVNLDDRREGGEDVTLNKEGNIVDITDFGPGDGDGQESEPQQKQQQRQGQMDDLESRMAGNDQRQGQQGPSQGPSGNGRDNQAAPQQSAQQQAPRQGQAQPNATAQTAPAPTQRKEVERLDPPVIDGKKNIEAWISLAEAAVAGLDQEQRAEWKKLHGNILDAAEYTMPHLLDKLSKMLP